MADEKPIIIIKKKGGHGGHHGGAWKVAYADFVTAMMAFFMVMWLVNSASEPVKRSVASYFRKPGIFESGSGTPLETGASGILEDAPPPKPEEKKKGSGSSSTPLKKNGGATDDPFDKAKGEESTGKFDKASGPKSGMNDKPQLTTNEPPQEKIEKLFEEGMPEDTGGGKDTGINDQELAEDVQGQASAGKERVSGETLTNAQALKEELLATPELKALSERLDIKVTPDGLSIEVMDTAKGSMFASGSDTILADARIAFGKIGKVLSLMPNSIDIVGHTDATPYQNGDQSNWDLSTARANSARRLLVDSGYDPNQVTNVIGRASKDLKRAENPLDPSNRRITIKVHIKSQAIADSLGKSLTDEKITKPQLPKKEEKPLTSKDVIDKVNEPNHIYLPGEEPGRRKKQLPDKIFGNAPVVPRDDFFTNY